MDLSQMSVEDFMRTDWGSEDSDNEEIYTSKTDLSEKTKAGNLDKNDTAANKKKRKKRKKKIHKPQELNEENAQTEQITEVGKQFSENDENFAKNSSHQQALNRLKEKDPEFYEFLQQEDSSLLKFDEEDFDIDASSSEDDDGAEVHKLPDKLEVASDSDLEDDSDAASLDDDSDLEDEEIDLDQPKKKVKDSGQIRVTEKMVEEWKNELVGGESPLRSLRDLMNAFHSAIARFSQDETDKKKEKLKLKYKVETGSMFNSVVGLCIRHVVPSLARILNYYPEKSNKKQALPSRSKAWDKVRKIMDDYLHDVISLNQLLLEPSVVCATLRHTILLIPYYLSFPKITKLLLKFLVKSWSSADDESVRVLAFLCINRIVKLDRKKYLEKVLKQTYLAYVANCKFTSPVLLPMINFMQQTLCELFALNPAVTYQLAFLYIRQLAIHLRKAMMMHKKENYQAVYNWQYVHCLGLWCRMVGNLHSNEVIKPLLYPLVQVSLGTINLVPTARYFPLRYHIIRYLTSLSDATNTYIPLLPYITKPLRLAEFSKKKGGSAFKPLTFSTILKLSNFQLKEGVYRTNTMDEVYFALLEYANTQAHTISFPEMMVPTMISLKKYVKNCQVPAYCKLMRQVIDRVDESSKFILEKRSNVPFAVTDPEAVTKWEKSLREQGVPFHKHYANFKKLHRRETEQAVADKNRVVEERLPVVDRRKFMEMSKTKDREEFGELFADNDETLEDLEFNVEKIVEEGKQRKKEPKAFSEEKDEMSDESDFKDEDVDSNLEEDSLLEEDSGDEQGKRKKSRTGKKKAIKRGNDTKTKSDAEKSTKKQKLVADVEDDGEPDIVEEFRFSDNEN